ncbi:PKD domain-containing protein [Methanocorpusculum sp. MG]|uniref:PKD domain-containing protein n=1 Tax=Methanocorpusculum petauri TaxID=3002863 RepID=A0ABT4IHL3_9EURY|nr:PKD domain-containing protein [Methanocorpusculum petauri]MCZ0860854.1 PKD domain-containing protein [Methanocorpusculum petauri]
MRKILVMLLVFALVIGCVGVVSAEDNPADDTLPNVDEKSSTLDDTEIEGEPTPGSSVTPAKPVLEPLISNKISGSAPLTVEFTVTATSGNPTGYVWNFGDSNTTPNSNTKVTHNFTTVGKHTVKVWAMNGTVASDPRTLEITVTDVLIHPVVNELIANETNGRAPLSVLFTATATHSTEYTWTFGDGTAPQTTTNNTVTHVFTKTGTHTVNVIAKNTNGTSEPKSTTIVVNANTSAYKVAIDATPVKGVAPLTVKFTLNTTIPDEDLSKVDWNFGVDDKSWISKSNETYKSPSWTYTEDGDYKVKLTVESSLTGKEYQTEITISVSDLVAAFDASKTSGAAPLEVKFTDKSTGPTSWKWTIYKTDDGSRTLQKELTNQNITYTFDREGKYEVELAAIKGSKSVTTYKEIIVSAKATTATTVATTKATTAPTTAATTSPIVKTAALSDDDSPVPNPMDIIEEFLRLLKVMLVPENYSLAP